MNRVLLTLLALLTGLSVPAAAAETRVVAVDQAAVGAPSAQQIGQVSAAVMVALSRPYAHTIARFAPDAPLALQAQVAMTTTVRVRIDRARE